MAEGKGKSKTIIGQMYEAYKGMATHEAVRIGREARQIEKICQKEIDDITKMMKKFEEANGKPFDPKHPW